MKGYIIVKGRNCFQPVCSDPQALQKRLVRFSSKVGSVPLSQPVVVQTDDGRGLAGSFVVGQAAVLARTRSNGFAKLLVDNGGLQPQDVEEFFIEAFRPEYATVELIVVGERGQWLECQEPGCQNHAVKEWHGRLVCSNHFDQFRDQEHERLQEFRP